jgi:hypothetical protein
VRLLGFALQELLWIEAISLRSRLARMHDPNAILREPEEKNVITIKSCLIANGFF